MHILSGQRRMAPRKVRSRDLYGKGKQERILSQIFREEGVPGTGEKSVTPTATDRSVN